MNGSQRVVNQRTRIRLKLESSDDESEKSKDSKLHDSTLYKRKINKISE